MTTYLDSSALAKLVMLEAESPALRTYLSARASESSPVRSSILAETEVRRAAARNGVSQTVASLVLDRLDLADLTRDMFSTAGLLPGSSLRTLDALHITAAMRMQADAFVTYDLRQADAARECGLHVVAPA